MNESIKQQEFICETQPSNNQIEWTKNIWIFLNEVQKWNISKEKLDYFTWYILNICKIEVQFQSDKNKLLEHTRTFIQHSLQNTLTKDVEEFNLSQFDIDWHTWIDSEEQNQYIQTLTQAIQQIIAVWWLGNFYEIHSTSGSTDGLSNIDKFLASKLDFFQLIESKNNWKWFISQVIQKYWKIPEQEWKNIHDKKFNLLSTESWEDLSILLIKEFWDGIENLLKILANIPASIILLPRYLQYRAEANSSNETQKVRWEILLEELTQKNPTLQLLNFIGEEWIELIKHIAEMFTSGKTWDIASSIFLLPSMLAWWSWLANMWLKIARKNAILKARNLGFETRIQNWWQNLTRQNLKLWDKISHNMWKISQQVDTFMSTGGIWHVAWMIWNYISPQLAWVQWEFLSSNNQYAENVSQVSSSVYKKDSVSLFPSQTHGEISYYVNKNILHIEDMWKNITQSDLVALFNTISKKYPAVTQLDFSLIQNQPALGELKTHLNELFSKNYPALSIERLSAWQRVVNITFSWWKSINDSISKEFYDLIVEKFKQQIWTNLEHSSSQTHARIVRSDYKHITISLNSDKDFLWQLFANTTQREQFIWWIFNNISESELQNIFKTISPQNQKTLQLNSKSSPDEIRKILFQHCREKFDFGIWTHIVTSNASFEDKLRAFYQADTSAKRWVENGNIEAKEFSFNKVQEFANIALNAEQKAILNFSEKSIEVNNIQTKIIVENGQHELILNPILLRHVRKWWVLPNAELQILVSKFVQSLNEWFDFISPIVEPSHTMVSDINTQIRNGVIDIKHATHNYKWTFTKTALEEYIEGKKWTTAFIDIIDMWIMNLLDFRELAKKVSSNKITQNNFNELLHAWWSVTQTFQSLVQDLQSQWIQLSLGGDEVFMFSPHHTPSELSNIIADTLEKKWLRGRVTFSENTTDMKKTFDTLDSNTNILKSIEQKIEWFIIQHNLWIKVPGSIILQIWEWIKVPTHIETLITESHIDSLYKNNIVEIQSWFFLTRLHNNQIILSINTPIWNPWKH